MYPFPPSVNPVLRSYIDAQTAFFNGLSQAMSRSFQQVGQLNMQLHQTLCEEAANVGQGLLTTERPTDILSAAALRAQPAAEKMRAYQQQLSQLAAATQVDLAQVTEQHVQETSRTARALVDDVKRVVTEETDKSRRQQEEAIRNFSDPFKQENRPGEKTGAQFQGNLQSAEGEADARVKADGAGHISVEGNMQGNQPRQPGNKQPGQTR